MIVSHDRYFMDRLVDHLFVFEGEGMVNNFPGNYTLYREWVKDQEILSVDKLSITGNTKNVNSVNEQITIGIEKKKPSFKEKREFELLEKEIADLTKEKEMINSNLSNSKTAFEELQKLSLRISDITQLLDEKELRWLELSDVVQ